MAWKLQNGLCFGDIVELDHVCELLTDCVETLKVCPDYDPVPNGPIQPLINAVETQKRAQREHCDLRSPGAFDRSFLPDEYGKVSAILEVALWHPKTLIDKLNDLILGLHRLMIIGNMAEDQLKAVLAEKEKKARRDKENAINAVANRLDQIYRKEFVAWAKKIVSAGKTPRNVVELQKMLNDGFKPEWSRQDPETLKRWAREEAGMKFKGGRTKNEPLKPPLNGRRRV